MSTPSISPAPVISIITPAFNEERNLPVLHERLKAVLDGLGVSWEWLLVDDHSRDATFETIRTLSEQDSRVRGIRLTRNYGSHAALMCGMEHARGECAIALAGDLQDPPEVIPRMVEKWRKGVKIVWAVRNRREGETVTTIAFSRLFYFVLRRFVGIKEIAPRGADMALVDRVAIDALCTYKEGNINMFALLTWMGFDQDSIIYDKQARLHGVSGWDLEKKLKMVADSVTAFTYRPIRLMSYVGFLAALAGFCYAGFVIVNRLRGQVITGWSSLMVVILVIGGIQMVMMGILGEYLWRTLDESRRRPRYLIEKSVNNREQDRP